jgi:hypothetical protein
METQLGTESDAAFDLAKAIYEQGGNSKSYAEITVPALTTKVNKGDALSGVTSAGLPVTGTAYDEADVGATLLQFQYDTTSDQASYVNCQVGGLVEKNLVGCKCAFSVMYTLCAVQLVYFDTPVLTRARRVFIGHTHDWYLSLSLKNRRLGEQRHRYDW